MCSLLIFYDRHGKNPPERIFELISEIDELRTTPSTELYLDKAEEAEEIDEISDLLAGASPKNPKSESSSRINPDSVHIFQKEVQNFFDNALKNS